LAQPDKKFFAANARKPDLSSGKDLNGTGRCSGHWQSGPGDVFVDWRRQRRQVLAIGTCLSSVLNAEQSRQEVRSR